MSFTQYTFPIITKNELNSKVSQHEFDNLSETVTNEATGLAAKASQDSLTVTNTRVTTLETSVGTTDNDGLRGVVGKDINLGLQKKVVDLETSVATKASQAAFETLNNTVTHATTGLASKASQDSLDSTNATVALKANASDLENYLIIDNARNTYATTSALALKADADDLNSLATKNELNALKDQFNCYMSSCGVEKGYFFENGNLYIIFGEIKDKSIQIGSSTNQRIEYVEIGKYHIYLSEIDNGTECYFKIQDRTNASIKPLLIFQINESLNLTTYRYTINSSKKLCLVVNDYENFQKLKITEAIVDKEGFGYNLSSKELIDLITSDSFLFYKALKEIFTLVVRE